MDMAAIGKTARPGYWIGFSGSVGSITCIDSIGLSMRMPIDSPSVEIRNIQLTETAQDTVFGPVPLIDEFGQWIPAEWPGKAKSLEALTEAWSEEDSSLVPGNFKVSKYGGFPGTKLKATGFFRIEKVAGRWWFVDPEGYLFYSTGSTGIGPRSEFARVKGREQSGVAARALPKSESSSKQHNLRHSRKSPARKRESMLGGLPDAWFMVNLPAEQSIHDLMR